MSSPLKVVDPFYCEDFHNEGSDVICNMHGFWWPEGRAYCNAISDDLINLINYALRASLALQRIAGAVDDAISVTDE